MIPKDEGAVPDKTVGTRTSIDLSTPLISHTRILSYPNSIQRAVASLTLENVRTVSKSLLSEMPNKQLSG